jgi:hypothetical protein
VLRGPRSHAGASQAHPQVDAGSVPANGEEAELSAPVVTELRAPEIRDVPVPAPGPGQVLVEAEVLAGRVPARLLLDRRRPHRAAESSGSSPGGCLDAHSHAVQCQRGTAISGRSSTCSCSTVGLTLLPQRGHVLIQAVTRGGHCADLVRRGSGCSRATRDPCASWRMAHQSHVVSRCGGHQAVAGSYRASRSRAARGRAGGARALAHWFGPLGGTNGSDRDR